MDFHKSCHPSKDCCFARSHPFWIIPPNVVFLDGHCRDIEIYCNLLKMIGTVIRHPFFINQCAFKLLPDKLRFAFDTIDKIYELFEFSRNGIPLKFRKFLRQIFTNTSPHQVEDESISKAFQIAFGRRYDEKVCSVPLAVAVREKPKFYRINLSHYKTDGVGLKKVIYPPPITREQHNVSATKIQSKWRIFQSKDKARSLRHQKHVATITTSPPWILFHANVSDHNYERFFQSLDYSINKKQSIQENVNNNWTPFLDCYQSEIVQKLTSIIISSSPISINEWTDCHAPFHWKNLFLQRWRCWSFVQKMLYTRIGSCFFRLRWTISLLLKLTMTIWNMWQFRNDIILLSSTSLAAVVCCSMKDSFLANRLPVLF